MFDQEMAVDCLKLRFIFTTEKSETFISSFAGFEYYWMYVYIQNKCNSNLPV